MGKKSKRGHTRHAQHEHHRHGEGHHHHHKLTVHGHHDESHGVDHDDALLDQLLDEFDVSSSNQQKDLASTPSDGKIKQSHHHLDQTPETVASTPPRESVYLPTGQEDEMLDKLLDEFDDPSADQKSVPQTPQRKDGAVTPDNTNNIEPSVVVSPRAHLGDVSEVLEVDAKSTPSHNKDTPTRSLHYMTPTSTSLSREATARKVRNENTTATSNKTSKKTPVRSRTKGTPHYMLPTSLSRAREHHEDNSINASKSFDATVDKSVKSRSSNYTSRSTYSHYMAPTANSQARDIHTTKSFDAVEKSSKSVKSSNSSVSQFRYSHFMAPTENSQQRDLHNASTHLDHSAEISVKSVSSIARSTASSHFMASTSNSRAKFQQPIEKSIDYEKKSSMSIKSNVKTKTGVTLTSPFNFRISARAKEREERQKYFAEVAERTQKEKMAQLNAQKKRVRSERVKKDMRPSLISAPPKKPTVPGKVFGLHTAARAEISQREIEQREARRAKDEAARATTKKRLPAEFDPKTLRTFKLHEESAARQREMQQLAERKPLYKPFHSRPVPKTTYEPKPISSHQEEEPEWYRKYHKSRLDKYESIKKKEEEQSNPTEWKPLPVPVTTYKEQAISTHLDEALERAKQRKEERARKQQLAEEQKKKENEKSRWRARPVPETTYRRPRDVSPHARSSMHRFEEGGERKRQEAKRKEAEAARQFRARPLPGNYNHSAPPLSKSGSTTNSSVASFNRHAEGPCITKPLKAKAKETFHARPIPKTTYEPMWVEPRSSQSIPSAPAKKSAHHGTKPVAKNPKSKAVSKATATAGASKTKKAAQPKPRPSVVARRSKVAPVPATVSKAKPAAENKNANFQERLRQKRSVFKARPMPKSTTQGFRPVAAQKPTTATTRSKSKSTARLQPTTASRPVATKPSFSTLDSSKPADYIANGDTAQSTAPPNMASSIFSSTSAFSHDGPGKQQSEDEQRTHEIVQNLNDNPNAEITFGQDDADDELAAILDEGPTGEVTAEITFTAADDGNNDSFEELAAILGDDPFGPSKGETIQDEHDAELAAILDD